MFVSLNYGYVLLFIDVCTFALKSKGKAASDFFKNRYPNFKEENVQFGQYCHVKINTVYIYNLKMYFLHILLVTVCHTDWL